MLNHDSIIVKFKGYNLNLSHSFLEIGRWLNFTIIVEYYSVSVVRCFHVVNLYYSLICVFALPLQNYFYSIYLCTSPGTKHIVVLTCFQKRNWKSYCSSNSSPFKLTIIFFDLTHSFCSWKMLSPSCLIYSRATIWQ